MINLRIYKNTKIYNFLEYLLVTLLILESNSVYSQIYGIHLFTRAAMIIVSSIITLLFILNKKNVLYKDIIKFIIYVFICSLCMFFNTNNIKGKIIILLVFVLYLPLTLIYLCNLSREDFINLLKKFVNVVIVLCLISLIFWSLSSILNILQPTGKIKVVWGKPYSTFDTFFNLHFNTQDVWWITGEPLMRNTGIFTEGPMYAFVLIIALIFNNLLCFENTKSNLIKTVILFITMLSTISVTGIICALFIIISNLICYLSNKNNKLFWITVTSILIIFIIASPLCINILNKKLQTGSAIHRKADIKNGIEAFIETPILGKGILHDRPTEEEYENGYGYSNTIIPVLSDGGIVLGVIYVFPIILFVFKSFKEYRENKIKCIVLTLIYIIILFTTVIQYRLSLMFLISIIYCFSVNTKDSSLTENYMITSGGTKNEK